MKKLNNFLLTLLLLAAGGASVGAMNRASDTVQGTPTSRCSICLNEIIKESENRGGAQALTCGCVYHKNCIEGWLNVKPTCPLCLRKQFLSKGKLVFEDETMRRVMEKIDKEEYYGDSNPNSNTNDSDNINDYRVVVLLREPDYVVPDFLQDKHGLTFFFDIITRFVGNFGLVDFRGHVISNIYQTISRCHQAEAAEYEWIISSENVGNIARVLISAWIEASQSSVLDRREFVTGRVGEELSRIALNRDFDEHIQPLAEYVTRQLNLEQDVIANYFGEIS